VVIEDTKLSSLESAQDFLHTDHNHFPHYVPVAIVGILLVIGFVFYQVSLHSSPQVAGASTENTVIDQK